MVGGPRALRAACWSEHAALQVLGTCISLHGVARVIRGARSPVVHKADAVALRRRAARPSGVVRRGPCFLMLGGRAAVSTAYRSQAKWRQSLCWSFCFRCAPVWRQFCLRRSLTAFGACKAMLCVARSRAFRILLCVWHQRPVGAGSSWQPNRAHACVRATQTALPCSVPRMCRLGLAHCLRTYSLHRKRCIVRGMVPVLRLRGEAGRARGGRVRTRRCPPSICIGATPDVRALDPGEHGCWLEVLWLAPRIGMARTVPVVVLADDRERSIARVTSDREPARARRGKAGSARLVGGGGGSKRGVSPAYPGEGAQLPARGAAARVMNPPRPTCFQGGLVWHWHAGAHGQWAVSTRSLQRARSM